jgi:hypothetical protein
MAISKNDVHTLVRHWYDGSLGRFASWDRCVDVVGASGGPSGSDLTFRVYTAVNRYTITAQSPRMQRYQLVPVDWPAAAPVVDSGGPYEERMSDGYLGYTASCRTPCAGEDWTRGNDLADGPLTEETWNRIIGDIVSYEMVHVHRRREDDLPGCGVPDETPSTTTNSGV